MVMAVVDGKAVIRVEDGYSRWGMAGLIAGGDPMYPIAK